jgi:hypothetical protein
MVNRFGHWMSLGIVLFVLAACLPLPLPLAPQPTAVQPLEEISSPTPAAQQTPDVPSRTPSPEEEETVPPIDYSTIPQVQQAMADLADRLGIDASAITVVRVEEVTWPDGSLGCPQPDMQYMQMLVNGIFIQLQVDDQTYNYHGGGAAAPRLCQSKNEVLPEDLPDNSFGSGEDT